MADDTQQQPTPPPDLNAAIQALIQQQIAAASGQGSQVQLPNLPAPQAQTQYSNDPAKGPDLLERIGLALGGGSLPGAPAELRAQMGRQGLLNFGIGLMSAGKFATPGQVFAGGLRGAQQGLLGSEGAVAGQQEYALNAQAKLAELGMQQQKNRTEALNALVPLLQMQGRLGLPPLFGPGSQAGPPGGGPGGDGDGQDIYSLPKDQFLPAVAKRESGGDPTALNYVAKADPTAYDRGATASGKYQMVNSTWQTAAKAAGIDTNKYPTAASAPEAMQDAAASKLYDMQGTAPWNPSKWTKNWVQGSDGKYTLQTAPYTGPPGASKGTPPTQGAGGSVGPYKPPGAAPADAGPPGSTDDSWFPSATPAPPAGGGGQLSIGDVALPPAKGSAANVVPGLTLDEATQVAVQRKQAVPFGNQGQVVQPDGTVTGGGPRKRADAGGAVQGDVGAILAGMQGAGGGAPDTVVQAAGPAAGGPPGIGSALAPPTPGLATSIGPVRAAPAAPAPPAVQPQPQPPAQPTQPPARVGPDLTARNDDGTFVVPNDNLSLPDYQQRFRHVPTADELTQRGLVIPGNEAEAQAAARGVQEAETAAAAAQRAANLAQQPGYNQSFGTVADLMKANIEAQAKAQAAREKYADMLQDTTKTNAAALQKYYDKQDTDLAANYKAEVLDPRNTRQQQQQASDLKIKEGLVAAGTADDQKVLQGIDATTESAHDTLSTLDVARRLSIAAGNKSALATLAPGVATMLQRSGLLSQDESNKLDAQSALDGVLSKMAGTMRTSMGFSRMTNMDLQFLQNMVGTSNIPESRRNAMFAFMQTALERQYQYGAYVREFYGGGPNAGGMTLAKARELADEKLGHIVQTVPDGPTDKQDLFVQQKVTPGTFYVRDGQLRIRGQ